MLETLKASSQLRFLSWTPGGLSDSLRYLHLHMSKTEPQTLPLMALLFFLWFSVFQRMAPLSTWWLKSDIWKSFWTPPSPSHLSPVSHQALNVSLLTILQVCPLFFILTRLCHIIVISLAHIIVAASNWGSLSLVLSLPLHHSFLHSVTGLTFIFLTYIFC